MASSPPFEGNIPESEYPAAHDALNEFLRNMTAQDQEYYVAQFQEIAQMAGNIDINGQVTGNLNVQDVAKSGPTLNQNNTSRVQSKKSTNKPKKNRRVNLLMSPSERNRPSLLSGVSCYLPCKGPGFRITPHVSKRKFDEINDPT